MIDKREVNLFFESVGLELTEEEIPRDCRHG